MTNKLVSSLKDFRTTFTLLTSSRTKYSSSFSSFTQINSIILNYRTKEILNFRISTTSDVEIHALANSIESCRANQDLTNTAQLVSGSYG